MKILFVGDIVGACGREAFYRHLPGLRQEYALDMVVVNGENAAHGRGLTLNISEEFFEAGVDVITMGNHVWDNKDIFQILDYNPRVIRPGESAGGQSRPRQRGLRGGRCPCGRVEPAGAGVPWTRATALLRRQSASLKR